MFSLQERCSTWKVANATKSIWSPTLALTRLQNLPKIGSSKTQTKNGMGGRGSPKSPFCGKQYDAGQTQPLETRTPTGSVTRVPVLSPWCFNLALYSWSLALTKLFVFSPVALRPTPANADQGSTTIVRHLHAAWVASLACPENQCRSCVQLRRCCLPQVFFKSKSSASCMSGVQRKLCGQLPLVPALHGN